MERQPNRRVEAVQCVEAEQKQCKNIKKFELTGGRNS